MGEIDSRRRRKREGEVGDVEGEGEEVGQS